MVDFSHLGALEVTADKTAEYKIHQITVNGKTPVLILAPATDANKGFFNALLRRSSKQAAAVKAGKVDVDMIEEHRDEDRDLYPKHVAKGWIDMVDANGADVKFTLQNVTDFLKALPNWVFDDVREFAREPSNFVDSLDVEIKAKN